MKPSEKSHLEKFFIEHNAEIQQVVSLYNIDNVPAFLGQIAHESDHFNKTVESLNYRWDKLHAVFGKRRISYDDCVRHGRHESIIKGRRVITQRAHQEAIANIVYGGSFGNKNLGNYAIGDGWKFRGRTYMMCTGRWNYAQYGRFKNVDLVENPDLILDDKYLLDYAGYYWMSKEINKAGINNKRITEIINGGIIGIYDRIEKTLFFQQLIKKNGFK